MRLVSEAAQRHGVSKQAIHKRVTRLVAAGRLSTRPGTRGAVLVNIVALNRAIAEESDPAQALRNAHVATVTPSEAVDDDPDDAPPDRDASPAASSSKGSYHQSRAEREAYQAENARIDLAERLGQLASRDDVEHRTMTAFRRVRDRLLAFPATVADRVAAAPDAIAVRNLLNAELRRVLEHLASELDHLGDDETDDDDEFGDSRQAAE